MPRFVIFDSGIGGLTVFSKWMESPHHPELIYVADNQYFPYGLKTHQELIEIIKRLLDYFSKKAVDGILIACNTASLIFTQYLKDQYDVPIYSIIDSTIEELNDFTTFKKVGIIGTETIIASSIYEETIKSRFSVDTVAMACSPLIDYCEHNDRRLAKIFLKNNFSVFHDIDILILACTHFNTIVDLFDDYFHNQVKIIRSGERILKEFHPLDEDGAPMIYLTKSDRFYPEKIHHLFPNLKNIPIETLSL